MSVALGYGVAARNRRRRRSEQVLHVRQVVVGIGLCSYCSRRATWEVATGPDPDLVPHCGEHAAELVAEAAKAIARL